MADNFINKINVNNEDYFISPTFTSQTKNYVLAAPSTANGVPSFRALVAADIPDLNSTYLKLNGSNNMTADVNIIAGDTDKFVNFWYNTNKKAGASWRIGMLGSGSNDTNYFIIQSGTSTTSATTWNDVFRIGQNTFNIYIPSTTASTSTSTGALTVGGGLGVAGQVTATSLHGTLATTDLSGIVSTTAKKFLKDTGAWTQVDWGDLTNVPSTFAPSAHEHNYIGKDGFIAYPSDGRNTISSSTVTGYIKIKIPQTKSQTMFTFDVDIYNYSNSTSTRYHIGGYNYNNASWNNCTAYCIAPLSNTKANLSVRFLSNGTDEMYVTIGETDTNWNYPQIAIHNIAISFSSQATLEKWKSGWTITIDSTAFDNSLVKQTITNTNIAYTAENVTGTVAIANGGTGTATTTPNYVFAGPNSGSTAGAPSFRKLVAADIPDLSWNKITSDKPTTLSGYGITDAKIASGTITLGSNTITPVTKVNGHTGNEVTVTAGDLGLSSALRYQGTTTTTMSDGLTTAKVKINNADFTPTAGDVVIYNDAEYLWTGSLWELIGAESSFKKVQTAVNSSSASGSSATTFVSSVTQDTQGVITVKTSTLNTSGTWSGTATNATNATTATYIKCTDTRNVELEPTDMAATQGVRFDFKAKSTINLTAIDTYAGVMTLRPYAHDSNWSGGPVHQLAFNTQGIHWRTGTSTWNAWERLATANEVMESKIEIIRLA